MLSALDDQLRILAQNEYDKFRKEVSEREGGKLTDEQLAALKEFIFLLPATLKQFSIYWNRRDTPPNAKRVSGYIMTYLYEPNDFLPEAQHGLFGYLDDAYLVVQTYLTIQDRFLRDWHQKSPEELELLERAKRLITGPRMLIPDVTERIDKLVESIINGDKMGFGKSMVIGAP